MRHRSLLVVSALLVCAFAWWLWPPTPSEHGPSTSPRSIRPVSAALVAPRPVPLVLPPHRAPRVVPALDPSIPAPQSEEDEQRGRIVGWVGGEDGVPRGVLLFVKGEAAVRALSVPPDGFFELVVAPGRYAIHAVGPDVDLEAGEQDTVVEVGPGAEVEIELGIDAPERIDPGVVLVDTDDGLEVLAVLEGSTADRLGLLPGDRLLSVDGQPVAGLSTDEVTDRLGRGEVEAMAVWFDDEGGGFEELVEWNSAS